MLMLAGTGTSGVSSRGSEGKGQQAGQQGVALERAAELPLPSQGKSGCSGWGEVEGQTKHPPLLGMRRQQGRDRGEMECWETRADRLPAERGERSPGVPADSPNLPSTLLKSLGPPKPTQCSLLSPSFSPKYGSLGQPLIFTPLGPVSMRKWRTSCSKGSPGRGEKGFIRFQVPAFYPAGSFPGCESHFLSLPPRVAWPPPLVLPLYLSHSISLPVWVWVFCTFPGLSTGWGCSHLEGQPVGSLE